MSKSKSLKLDLILMPQTSGSGTREQDHSGPHNVPILAPLFVLESTKTSHFEIKNAKIRTVLDSLAFGPRSGPPL